MSASRITSEPFPLPLALTDTGVGVSLGAGPLTPCPVPPDPTAPVPESLAYSLTLPAALVTPSIARATARTLLHTHGLTDLIDPALQVIGELTATACKFTATAEIYLSLRYRDDALRITLYDDHGRHTNRRLAAHCDARRRASLRLLACVVRSCSGKWGYAPAAPPTTGTRMWTVLPHTLTATYSTT